MKTKPSVYNNKEWRATRDAILKRDNHACRICGASDGESSLHVHHVDRNTRNMAHSNLVTLCLNCHHQVHSEDYWPSDWPNDMPPWGVLE
jgi:5-methylcytosine-specific restriction endonuclease McrA